MLITRDWARGHSWQIYSTGNNEQPWLFLNPQNDAVVCEDCRVCTRELSQRKIVAKSMLIFH